MNLNEKWRQLTRKQQQAVVVCAVCALVLVITISVTAVLVTKQIRASQNPQDPDSQTSDYDDSNYTIDSTAVLEKTEDAGAEYLKDTLFIGDSNTVRLYNNGMVTLQQYCAKEGLTIQDANTMEIVSFKKDAKQYTIVDAITKMKPRRVLITLGTNNADGSLSEEDFIASYRKLIESIQNAYSYTDIIINAIPAIPQNHAKYPDLDQKVIDNYNMALAKLCEETNCKFLNSAQALKDENGYGKETYYNKDDIHLTSSGLKAMLDYYTTHAHKTEDRRPDTKNIATRAEDFTTNPTPESSAKPTEEPVAGFTASYHAQPSGSGTLTMNNESGKDSFKVDIKDAGDSVTVKAVPNEGNIFVKWSDGVTSMERTDKKFKQNLDVTAMFASLNLSISADRQDGTVDDEIQFKAKLSSDKYAKIDDVVWFVDGEKVDGVAGGSYKFSFEEAGTLKVAAEVTYNGQTVRSNTVKITVEAKATATPTPAPTPTPTPTPAPTATPSPTPVNTPDKQPEPEVPVEPGENPDGEKLPETQPEAAE